MSTPSGMQWRYSAMKVRLGPFDATVVAPPLLLFLMHIKIWTFVIAVTVAIAMWIVELYFHMPLGVVRRSIRSFIAGDKRTAIPWWKQNHL